MTSRNRRKLSQGPNQPHCLPQQARDSCTSSWDYSCNYHRLNTSIFSILLARVIKSFYEPPPKLKKDLNFWSLMFVALGVVSFQVIPARGYLFAVAGCKLIARIRLMCFEKLVHMGIDWFDEPVHSSGSIGARLSVDAATVRALVGDALGQMVHVIASAAAGLVIAFIASWQLAFIISALIPLIRVNGYIQIKFVKGFSANAKVCSKTNNLMFFPFQL